MQAKSPARLAALLLATVMFPAQAVFHFMKVVEVFPGTAASPNAQYVVIQMYVSGQQFVSGHAVTVFNPAGSPIATFTFPGNLPNGANQAKILIATPDAASFFGLSADLVMSPALLAAGGKVCFADPVDCVAWGSYSGPATGVGTPFNVAAGLQPGRAAIRRLNIAGSATVLDAGDDTNNCANDFVSGLPAPRNNAGMLGTIPSATCGNGIVQGLEQCDDGNLRNGDGCSSTCQADRGDGRSDILWRNFRTGANVIWLSASSSTGQLLTRVSNLTWKVVGTGDFDDDGRSDILWRNDVSGANAIWRSGISATPQPVTGVGNLAWKVVGVGDFNADGRSDILWRNDTTGANTIWRSAVSSTPQPVTGVSSLAWKVVGVGDFNADGRSDILWRNDATGANAIWMSALSSTPQRVTPVADLAWKVVGVGDFNADGRSDILWRNATTGANAIWRSGISATPQPVAAVRDLAWTVVGVSDFDGDGRADILWRNARSGVNVIWRSGSFSTYQVLTTVPDLSWRVVGVGDFNADDGSGEWDY